MSVRKREWTSPKGEAKSAWVVDYADARGKRRLKTFRLKKEADAFASKTDVEVREGTHIADRDTVTVEAAGKLWIATSEANSLERTTVVAYRERFKLHIVPFIGGEKISKNYGARRSRVCRPPTGGRAVAGHGQEGSDDTRRDPVRRAGEGTGDT